jgi:hypothetical protein
MLDRRLAAETASACMASYPRIDILQPGCATPRPRLLRGICGYPEIRSVAALAALIGADHDFVSSADLAA